jgi:hypothetical protein
MRRGAGVLILLLLLLLLRGPPFWRTLVGPVRGCTCCLLLQDLVEGCAREGEEDSGGHVLWDTTSRGLCGLAYRIVGLLCLL